MTWQFNLANVGHREGSEVVQAYWIRNFTKDLEAKHVDKVPIKQLFWFEKLAVPALRNTTVSVTISIDDLKLVDDGGHSVTVPGHYDIVVTRGHGRELKRSLVVEGEYHTNLELFV